MKLILSLRHNSGGQKHFQWGKMPPLPPPRKIPAPVISGVPQGTVLGPLMFLLYMNDINKNVTSSKLGLFADDCVIYKTIFTNDDSAALQKDLATLSDWARIWQMSFNVDKCVLLRFTRSHSLIINDYFLNNQAIQCSNVYKYLGIQLANTLSWDTHITTIVNKATRMLNFIKRNLSKCCCSIKSIAYTTLVRPILEYATEVWDPHYKCLIYKIQMVQRRAARWVLPDYRFQSSVTAMIYQLGWATLEQP